jgi:hypothetical protein
VQNKIFQNGVPKGFSIALGSAVGLEAILENQRLKTWDLGIFGSLKEYTPIDPRQARPF